MIREAQLSDADKLVALSSTIAAEQLEWFLPCAPMTHDSSVKTICGMAELDNALLLVAEDDGDIVGMLDCRPLTSPESHTGRLTILVLSEHRSRGVAKAMGAVPWVSGAELSPFAACPGARLEGGDLG